MKPIVQGAIFYADVGKTVGSEENGIRPENLPTHILVKQFDKIRHDSIIMLEQIRVIDKTRLKGFVGILTDQDMQEVDKGIMVSLGLK